MRPDNSANVAPLRIAVSDVPTKPTTRIKGQLLCGAILPGETILVSPDNIVASVASVEADDDLLQITLEQPVRLTGPSLVSHEDNTPVQTDVFLLLLDRALTAAHLQADNIQVETFGGPIDVSVQQSGKDAEIREILVRSSAVLALDEFENVAQTGQCRVLIDGQEVARGQVNMKGYGDQRQLRTVRATNITRVAHRVSEQDRSHKFGHTGGVLWLTGLSGSGKSTLAVELETELFNRGYLVYVLDGDNVRHGLNANLGFSPEDRSENIRRVGEVAALFARAGFIAISAFISPYQSDRERARAAADDFHEIFVSAGLEVCEERDPKGLYARARKGEIADFTGISAPYEEPERPALTVDTGALDIRQSVDRILEYVQQNFRAPDSDDEAGSA
jgi:bifunctional enzyme CysN/CysC